MILHLSEHYVTKLRNLGTMFGMYTASLCILR